MAIFHSILENSLFFNRSVRTALVFFLTFSRVVYADTYRIGLRWQPVQGVKRYKVQVSTHKNFSNIIEEVVTDEPLWIWKWNSDEKLITKSVFYRIASIDHDGLVGDFSDPIELELPSSTSPSNPRPPETAVTKPYLWKWNVFASAGLGSLSQRSNETNLKSVSTNTWMFQQRIGVSLDWLDQDSSQKKWSGLFQFQFFPFQRASEPKIFDQSSIYTYSGRLDLLKWWNPKTALGLGYGLSLDRSFRWVKVSHEAVDATGTFSLGPGSRLSLPFDQCSGPLKLCSANLFLGVPVTGSFTSGHWGLSTDLSFEWKILRFWKNSLRARVEGDFKTYYWTSPQNTSLVAWAVFVSPVIQFSDY